MARFDSPLDNVRVASPCNADWDQMVGNERKRFCGQCNLNVYNLSSMSKAEAEQLIDGTEGRLCVRYFKRVDGSILTRDCPVGLRAFRRKMSYVARAVSSAVLTFFAGIGLYTVKWNFENPTIMGQIAVEPRVLPVVESTLPEAVVGELVLEPPPKPQPRVRKRAPRS
jgi:hypothetical protein